MGSWQETSETSTTVPGDDSSSGTTTSTPRPGGHEDDLADAGYDGGWMVAVGAVLLLAGATVLLILRLRAARR